MAISTLFLRRAPASAARRLAEALLSSPRPTITPTASAPHVFRFSSFNTAAQPLRDSADESDHEADRQQLVSRPRGDSLFPSLFADVLEPFYPSRSLAEMLNFMDRVADGAVSGAPRGNAMGFRRGWEAREGEGGLYLRVDMPGLGKEDVKVTVEQDTLVIKGEAAEEGEQEGGRRYGGRIELPDKLYEVGKIRAEMKNGVLKVFVPKVREEERKDVLKINVE